MLIKTIVKAHRPFSFHFYINLFWKREDGAEQIPTVGIPEFIPRDHFWNIV